MRPHTKTKTAFLLFLCTCVFTISSQAQSLLGSNPTLPKLKNGSGVWADYNQDGLDDLFLCGVDSAGNYRSLLLYNNTSFFQQDLSSPITGVAGGDAAWGDYDGDNDPDLLITGQDSAGNTKTQLFQNNAGILSLVATPQIPGLKSSRAKWADLDADGDQDLFLAGYSTSLGFQGVIARNNGGGNFSVLRDSIYRTNDWPAIAAGDYDQDGLVDLAFADISPTEEEVLRVVILNNQGGMQFSNQQHFIPGFAQGSLQFGDDDGDGDLDLLCSGMGVAAITESYRFNAGQFQNSNSGLAPLGIGNAIWEDFNADGYLDIVSAGYDGGSQIETRVYLGSSTGYQLQQGPSGLPKVYYARLSTGDWNADGYPDLLMMGETSTGFPVTRIATWDNNTQTFQF